MQNIAGVRMDIVRRKAEAFTMYLEKLRLHKEYDNDDSLCTHPSYLATINCAKAVARSGIRGKPAPVASCCHRALPEASF